MLWLNMMSTEYKASDLLYVLDILQNFSSSLYCHDEALVLLTKKR